jgi:heat shock protein beta
VPEEEDVNLDAEDDEEEKEEKEDDLELGDEEDVAEEEEEEKEPEMEQVKKEEWNQVNTKKPIWTREKDEISDEEYKAFFGVIARNEQLKPMYWTHFKAEGNINFKSIVYLPEEIPYELMQGRYDQMRKGVVKLYVRKVLISDEFPLLPTYLSWVKGVVDSDDLPLNVNRETLQESKIIRIIGKKMVRKILEMMKKLSQEPHPTKKVKKIKEEKVEEMEFDTDGNVVAKDESEKEEDEENEDDFEEVKDTDKTHPYIDFYKKYHPSLKMGIIRDEPNRNRIMKLLRFKSSKANGENDWVSFDDYVKNMKEWQEDIYFMSGMSQEEVESSHFMKKYRRRDVEVLYFIDPVDEIMMQHAREYDGKQLKLISKEGTKLPAEDEDLEKRRAKVYEEKFKPLIKYIRKNLDVYEIKISQELEETPALISSSNYGASATMERIQSAQAFYNSDRMYQNTRILQLNPRHPIINKLLEKITPPEDWEEDEDDPEEYNPGQDTLDLTKMLYDMALINSGFRIGDVKTHSKRITRVLKNSMELESLEVADEIEIEEDDEEEEEDQDDHDGMPDFDMMDMDMGMGED